MLFTNPQQIRPIVAIIEPQIETVLGPNKSTRIELGKKNRNSIPIVSEPIHANL